MNAEEIYTKYVELRELDPEAAYQLVLDYVEVKYNA